MEKKYFIITVDTEGDNQWNCVMRRNGMVPITTNNGAYLLRFQKLCEKYGFVPTYLVNWEMAEEARFVDMARVALKEDKCEIGMHMHAWNCPPFVKIPFNSKGHNPYAGEYPTKVIYQKMKNLTKKLEDVFQMPIKSHRGGRWYIEPSYVRMLKKLGYIADCTVTPGVSWETCIGQNRKGVDFRRFPKESYELDIRRVERVGDSGIMEIPPTIITKPLLKKEQFTVADVKRWFTGNNKIWLRPDGTNLDDMLYLVTKCLKKDVPYIEFMIHSSELMPGGSPNFKSKGSIEKLYSDMEKLFQEIAKNYQGIGLSQYAELLLK